MLKMMVLTSSYWTTCAIIAIDDSFRRFDSNIPAIRFVHRYVCTYMQSFSPSCMISSVYSHEKISLIKGMLKWNAKRCIYCNDGTTSNYGRTTYNYKSNLFFDSCSLKRGGVKWPTRLEFAFPNIKLTKITSRP